MRYSKYSFPVIFLLIVFQQISINAQTERYVFGRNGDSTLYHKIENIYHLRLVDDVTLEERIAVTNALDSLCTNYSSIGERTFRLAVKSNSRKKLEQIVRTSNSILYCQNEYNTSPFSIVWPTNRILLKVKSGTDIELLLDTNGINYNHCIRKWFDSTIYALVIPKEEDVFEIARILFKTGAVEYAQPAFYRYVHSDGYNDNPQFTGQWYLKDTTHVECFDTTICYPGINAIRAWSITSGEPNIRVAVLDDGVDTVHPDLVPNLLFERNFTDYETSYLLEEAGHGTPCAGIIAAANNNTAIVGVAHNCKMASLLTIYRELNRDGNHPPRIETVMSDEIFEEAVHYACDVANISIFSCSWHIEEEQMSETVTSAINYATTQGRNGKGCVFVFSSGNRDDSIESVWIKPTAVLPNVLSVGALTRTGYRASSNSPDGEGDDDWESCYGDSLDLVAPGIDIRTIDKDGATVAFRGTSAAAPQVAGVAALVLSVDSSLTYRQVFEILCSTTTKVHSQYYSYTQRQEYPYGTWNNEMGYGLVNAHHAVLKTLYRDYYVSGNSNIDLCDVVSYAAHGSRPFNDSITCGWSSSANIEIISCNDTVVTARGIVPGEGWIAFNIIHNEDSLPLYFPIYVGSSDLSLINNELSTNTSISNASLVVSDLVIDSLATLTITDTLYIASGSRIIVRPGGKLIVNGGTLTSACEGEMWQGIIVEGHNNIRQAALAQGSVILNNATIENAWTAISTRGADTNAVYEHTGGIVQATNTLFRNNRRSVEFLSYENHTTTHQVTDNASYFTRCTFTVDDDNLFVAQGRNFQNHVTMWQVRGVKFNGCSFHNEMTGTSHRGKAVSSIEAGFNAKRVCPTISSTDPCVCENNGSDTVTRCSFIGFDTAIASVNSAGHIVTIDNCDFAQNFAGIFFAANDNAVVGYNDFDLDYTVNANVGLSLKNCTGYTVEDNAFHRSTYLTSTSVGIVCDSSGAAENVIRRNYFTNLNYGCYVKGRNALGLEVKLPPGLQFNCNEFAGCQMGIFVGDDGTVRTIQGSATAGADNVFGAVQPNGRSLTIPNDHTLVRYYYSTGNGHTPIGSSRYTLASASANSCSSTLCGIHYQPIYPRRGGSAIDEYVSLAAELDALGADFEQRGFGELNSAENASSEANAILTRMSDLSVVMSDLAQKNINGILGDSVVDMEALKEWYKVVNTQAAKYMLVETYSQEGDFAAASAELSALPDRFELGDDDIAEYRNYSELQQLRQSVANNWYKLSDNQIAQMQRVAESGNGRAARMAKEILCFFHHICYEEAVDYDEAERSPIGTRALQQTGSSVSADGEVRVYPNPANTTLTVAAASEMRELSVYDLTGRCVQRQSAAGTYIELNISALHSGTYILKVATEQGEEQIRFVKE